MTWSALLTLAVIVGVLIALMLNLASPDLVLLGGVIVLAAAGVITPADAFAGFSNQGMLTIAALFIVAAGLRETGAVALVTSSLLGRPKSERGAVARIVAPVVIASALLNNTTVVATLLPAVKDWARRINIAPSRLLLPLSYATILGGLCTLIGTSTNLVVAGMIEELAPTRPDITPLGMFSITPVGVAIALVGTVVIVALSPLVLPDRRPAVSQADDPRHYTMEVLVPEGSRLAGQSIEAAGLRHLPGAFLMEIVRGDEVMPVIEGRQRLRERDRLVFVGDVNAMVDLQRLPGLAAAGDQVFKLDGDRVERRIVEAVISARNPLVGRSIRDGRFRTRYGAVIIAVARAGERLPGRIGDIVLMAGDVLLVEATRDFLEEQGDRNDFYLVSTVDGASPPRFERAWTAGAILVGLVGTITIGLLDTTTASFIAAGAMVLTGACTLEESRRALDLTVLVTIAAAFGLGRAMQVTGLDRAVAEVVVSAGAESPILGLAAVYVATAIVTELVTNNAAAVLGVPVALSLADRLGTAPMPFLVAVMVAASAAFLTPIGYQTNLMVYNPGGYRPTDYPKLGLPLALAVGVTALAVIPVFFPLTAPG